MRTALIQPEYSLTTFSFLTIDCQLYPIFDWRLFRRCRAPDIASLNFISQQRVTISQYNTDRAVMRNFKRCWVRAVFFCFLRHEAYVLNRACSGRIKRTCFFKVRHRLVINWGIGAIRNNAVCVSGSAIRPPPFSTSTDQRWQ